MLNLDPEEESILVQYLTKRNPEFWDRTNILLFAFAVEHIIIALKIVIALLIPDVPFKVRQDELRRQKVIELANADLVRIKYEGGHKTFNEMQEDLQRQA